MVPTTFLCLITIVISTYWESPSTLLALELPPDKLIKQLYKQFLMRLLNAQRQRLNFSVTYAGIDYRFSFGGSKLLQRTETLNVKVGSETWR